MKGISSLEEIAVLREKVDVECKLAQGRDGKGEIPRSIWDTYSAFANTQGGDIFLGLKENKDQTFTLAGIENPQKVLDALWTTLNNPTKVSVNIIHPQWVRVIAIEGKSLIHIHIPRATRKQRPVFINGNPLNGTFRRFNSTDLLQDENVVRRMLAEQTEDSRDERILKGFSLADLDLDTIKAFKHVLLAHKSNHPWLELTHQEFLTRLGCWRLDRETQEEGLTLAGLLMFGQHRPIHEAVPNYFLDYQELPLDASETRWLDRVVPDGTWSGNLFDFYRRVIRKLEEGLKVPFAIQNNIRQDDSLAHQALREAFINCLVHADYSDKASVKVVKSPQGFMFRNPGMMRVPAEIALEGGESDCRNRTLHSLFLLLGLGERAGSGLPKIRQGWTGLGHFLRLFDTAVPYDQTVMQLNWTAIRPATQSTTQITTLKTTQITTQKQQEILAYLKDHPNAGRKDIARALGNITEDGVKYNLKVLQEIGLLIRVGSARSGYWEVKE